MKIACVTDDGKTISAHFGRAAYYAVLTVEGGQIVNRELRDKMGHAHFVSQDTAQGAAQEAATQSTTGHGTDAASHDRHVSMAGTIADCEALLCRGMGRGAYLSMERVGIKPLVTDMAEIDAAVMAYSQGRLVDHTDRLH
jgi:predicted Fe-Mo cluster-binding NifX family protein